MEIIEKIPESERKKDNSINNLKLISLILLSLGILGFSAWFWWKIVAHVFF